jgi:hypothetical protein
MCIKEAKSNIDMGMYVEGHICVSGNILSQENSWDWSWKERPMNQKKERTRPSQDNDLGRRKGS